MPEVLDLHRATRDEVVALVVALRERNADRERRLAWQAEELATLRAIVADLSARVGELLAAGDPAAADAPAGAAGAADAPPRGVPGLKPGPTPARPARPRRKRARGFGRRRMEPTARQAHAVDACPRCRHPLRGG